MDEGIAALAALLGDKQFFAGAQPCVADAAAFAFLDKCAAPVEPRRHAACAMQRNAQALIAIHMLGNSTCSLEPAMGKVGACSGPHHNLGCA